MRTTAEVLDHHLKCFAQRDGTMADDATEAVFFGYEGVLRGRDGIGAFLEKIFTEFATPGLSFARKQLLIEGGYAFIVWIAETPDNR